MRHAFVIALVLLGAGSALAERVPDFPVSGDVSLASHVIVARKRAPGGELVVEESLKGDLAPGTTLTVPFLAINDDPAERKVIGPSWAKEDGLTLKGERMYVFLRRSPKGEWTTSSVYDDIAHMGSRPSFVWVESGHVFGPYSGMGYVTPRPGAVRTEYLDDLTSTRPVDEARLRRVIADTIGAVASLDRARAIPDKAKRAEALFALIDKDRDGPALEALKSCGEAALPVLDRILADEERARLHFATVVTLTEIGAPGVDDLLVKQVEREAAFFGALPPGAKRDDKVQAHQLTTLIVLEKLQARHPESCRAPVEKLRETLLAARIPENGLATPGLTVECVRVIEALDK
jgi:hypothetical protein